MRKTSHPGIAQMGDRYRAHVYVPRAVQRRSTQKPTTQTVTSATFLWLDNAVKWREAATAALKAGRPLPNPARFRTIDNPDKEKGQHHAQ